MSTKHPPIMPRKYQESTAKCSKVTGLSELASELCHKLRRFSAFWRSASVAAYRLMLQCGDRYCR
eukprot:1391472-Pleurochrysis_carterae.AAC.1